MRITGVETVLDEYELSRPIGDVNIPTGMHRRTDLAVFIGTDEGPQGVAVASRLGAAAGNGTSNSSQILPSRRVRSRISCDAGS